VEIKNKTFLLTAFVVLGIGLLSYKWVEKSKKTDFTVYQLTDISEFRPQDGIKYSNVLPITYSLHEDGIKSQILNKSTVHSNCHVQSIHEWDCKEGDWSFGNRSGGYYSNAIPEENIIVSRLEYSINWCRWYLKKDVFLFLYKCPMNLILGP